MYVKVTNGTVDQYPYTVGNLRRDNPNTSFPKRPSTQLLEEWGVYTVEIESEPSYNERTQKVSLNDVPTLVNSSWVLSRSVTDKTAEEIADYDNSVASSNRQKRNTLLSETDWWALTDTPTMSDSQASFRQALRDITDHANWPHLEDADWPIKP